MRDLERDLAEYILGLWQMDQMRKQRRDFNGAIKLRGLPKKGQN